MSFDTFVKWSLLFLFANFYFLISVPKITYYQDTDSNTHLAGKYYCILAINLKEYLSKFTILIDMWNGKNEFLLELNAILTF